MPTAEKSAVIKKYTEKFKEAKCIYIADYKGIDVETVTEVRKRFRDQDIEYKELFVNRGRLDDVFRQLTLNV